MILDKKKGSKQIFKINFLRIQEKEEVLLLGITCDSDNELSFKKHIGNLRHITQIACTDTSL